MVQAESKDPYPITTYLNHRPSWTTIADVGCPYKPLYAAPMSHDAAYWIRHLELLPHPEGGYYHQTYRSDLVLPKSALPARFSGPRAVSTAIYFLLDEDNFSAFHRLRSDEMWHFYLGSPLLVHVIDTEGYYSEIRLGTDPEANEVFQATVKAGSWFASQLAPSAQNIPQPHEVSVFRKAVPERLSLVGCTVAPGFDFADFELARRDDLTRQYPDHRALISLLTRG